MFLDSWMKREHKLLENVTKYESNPIDAFRR